MKRKARIHELVAKARSLAFLIVPLSPLAAAGDFGAEDGATQNISLRAHAEDDVKTTADFRRRIHTYVDLHRRLDEGIPPLSVSQDPGTIQAAMDEHQAALRAARSTSKHGDMFSDEVARMFRRRIRDALRDTDMEGLMVSLSEENPGPSAKPRVNAPYPDGSPLSAMLPRLLLIFPALPDGLEYRFMNRDLILWDPHANLIADFILDALPPIDS